MKRVAIESGNGLIYVADPSRIDAVERGDSHPVGFPPKDVFAFDGAVFMALEEEWRANRSTDTTLWQRLQRYQPDEAAN